jgi:hypothetical protein
MKSLRLFPDPNRDLGQNSGDNPHFKLLMEGWDEIENQQLRIQVEKKAKCDAILILWPDSLLEKNLNNFTFRVLQHFDRIMKTKFSIHLLRLLVKRTKKKIEKCETPIFWQIHEIIGHYVDPRFQSFDHELRQVLINKAEIIFVTEISTLNHIQDEFTFDRKKVVVSQLGSYSPFYGPALESNEAKKRLGIPEGYTTILLFGRARVEKDFTKLFNELIEAGYFLILAGQGYNLSEVRELHTVRLEGFIEKEMVNVLFSAADFVIKPENHYLNSGVARLAISYGKPLIAYPYGATGSLAEGCLISITHNDGKFDFIKQIPSIGSEPYRAMCIQASISDEIRSWKSAAIAFHDSISKSLEGF